MSAVSPKRPVTATMLAVLQTLIAVANIAVAVIVVIAVRSPGVAQHSLQPEHAIMLNVVMVVVAAIATSYAAVGLWKRWASSWALTLALGLTVVLGMMWGPVFDHDHVEPDDIGVVVAFGATIMLALLGPVVRWYLQPRSAATTVSASSAQSKSGF